jgi:c-di-GMP-binding flagellar brake protein YcgR
MTPLAGVDHPAEQAEAEVALDGRGITITARVAVVHRGFLTVLPSVGQVAEQVAVAVGDPVAVYWTSGDAQRSLPARVTDVRTGADVQWRLEAVGPAETSQRREVVRARVRVPVVAVHGPFGLAGETVDLSESGLRAEFEGVGKVPAAGAGVVLALSLEDGDLTTPAEVVRTHARGALWVISVRFLDLPEKDQDRIRRRVFTALREERASWHGRAVPDQRG